MKHAPELFCSDDAREFSGLTYVVSLNPERDQRGNCRQTCKPILAHGLLGHRLPGPQAIQPAERILALVRLTRQVVQAFGDRSRQPQEIAISSPASCSAKVAPQLGYVPAAEAVGAIFEPDAQACRAGRRGLGYQQSSRESDNLVPSESNVAH